MNACVVIAGKENKGKFCSMFLFVFECFGTRLSVIKFPEGMTD